MSGRESVNPPKKLLHLGVQTSKFDGFLRFIHMEFRNIEPAPKKMAPFIAENREMRIFLDMPGALPRRRLLENHLQGVLTCLYVQLHNKNKKHNKKTTSVVPSNSFNIRIMIFFHNKKQSKN